MSISKKLKWRRSLSKLKYLHEELQLVKSASKEAGPEFEAYYRKFCAEKNVNIAELDKQHKDRLNELYGRNKVTDGDAHDEPEIQPQNNTSLIVSEHNAPPSAVQEYELTADEIAIHDAFSKLLKRIALVIHPDKLDKDLSESERESRISMFTECVNALEQRKYYILLEVAEKFNITTPKNYDLQIRWMKNASEIIEADIAAEKNTYNFCFAMAENEEQKEILIRKFLHQLFRLSVQ